jgi:hypothetical protein
MAAGRQAFLTGVRTAYAHHFPDDLAAFMDGNALAFLGFDDATNANNRRARERYRAQGVPVPSWLAG